MARSAGRATFILPAASSDRAEEAGRPAGGEQLLWIGAAARGAGRRQLDVEAAIRATGRTIPAAGGVGFGGVQNFFEVETSQTPPKLAKVVVCKSNLVGNTEGLLEPYNEFRIHLHCTKSPSGEKGRESMPNQAVFGLGVLMSFVAFGQPPSFTSGRVFGY